MTSGSSPQTSRQQRDPDAIVRVGGWLFERRTAAPVPLALVLLLVRVGEQPYSPALMAAGVAFVALGESVRLWAVRHIGAISRTRSDRLGPLISTGPFALVRNPLYLGNLALWVGFALAARLPWMAPVIVVLLGFEYHAIVRWEETLLEARRGDEYRAYAARVPRWLPIRTFWTASASPAIAASPTISVSSVKAFPWRDTFFSERGTLIAIAAGFLLLYLKFTV